MARWEPFLLLSRQVFWSAAECLLRPSAGTRPQPLLTHRERASCSHRPAALSHSVANSAAIHLLLSAPASGSLPLTFVKAEGKVCGVWYAGVPHPCKQQLGKGSGRSLPHCDDGFVLLCVNVGRMGVAAAAGASLASGH